MLRFLIKTFFPALILLFFSIPGFSNQQTSETRININTASAQELMQLPGIGQVCANRIVEYRRKHGAFKRPQEIIIVQGMSAKRYRRIAHLIRI